MACKAAVITHENSDYLTAPLSGLPSSSSADEERTRRAWLEQLRSKCGSDEGEFERGWSKPTWMEMDCASSCLVDSPSTAELKCIYAL